MTTAAFRAGAKAPELWSADSARIERPAVYDETGGVVRLPLQLGPHGSVFVIFREAAAPQASRIVSVTREGRELLGVKVTPPPADAAGRQPEQLHLRGPGSSPRATPPWSRRPRAVCTAWPKNATNSLPPRTAAPSAAMVTPAAAWRSGATASGVFEHGASYFSPTLMHAAPIPDWTHLAVVYRNGQATLYLNGQPVHTGLKSAYIVHSGAGQGLAGVFRGQVGALVQFPRPLSDAEIAELAKNTPRPGANEAAPPRFTLNPQGQIEAQVTTPGEYELKFADGTLRTLKVAAIAPAIDLTGTWEVAFTPNWGAPERANFATLESWTPTPRRRDQVLLRQGNLSQIIFLA